MEHEDAVRDRIGLFEVVRGEQDGTALLGLLAHGGPEGLAGGDIHAGGRLVENDQVVGPGGGEREPYALLLAAGELVDHPVGDRRDAGAGQDVGDRVRPRVQIADEPDDLLDRDVLHQAAALQHRADPAPGDRLLRGRTEEPDRAGVRGAQAEEQIEGGGLSGAVGAEERHGLAGVQVEGEPVDGAHVPVYLADLVEADHGRLRGGGFGDCRCHAPSLAERGVRPAGSRVVNRG